MQTTRIAEAALCGSAKSGGGGGPPRGAEVEATLLVSQLLSRLNIIALVRSILISGCEQCLTLITVTVHPPCMPRYFSILSVPATNAY